MNPTPPVREPYVSGTWDMRLTDTSVALAALPRERARRMDTASRDFARMVEEHFPRGVRFCARLLGDATEGEEVAQAAFVKLYEAGHKPWEQGDPLPFLYRVLRNACVDHVRRRRVRRHENLDQAASTPDLAGAERAEVHEALLKAIAALDEAQRQVVFLRFFEGLSLPQTAKVIERSAGATAMLLTRAKARLKEMLGRLPEFQDEP